MQEAEQKDYYKIAEELKKHFENPEDFKSQLKRIHNSIHGGATLQNISNKYRIKMIDGKPVKKKERISKAESRRKNARTTQR